MTLQKYQLQIGSLTMGPSTNYIVHNVQGFGVPNVRVGDTDRPLDHGLFYGRDFISGRTITIDLTVIGTSDSDAMNNLDALLAAWTPVSSDATTTKPLIVNLAGLADRQLNGRPRRASADVSRMVGNRIPVSLEYVAADPRVYSNALKSATLVLAQSTTGRAYNRAYNYGYGAGSSASQLLTNAGDFATRPVVTINGPVTNPFLENTTAGQTLFLSITLASGDVLVVDFDARTVILGGTASRYSAVQSGSTFWELAPGSSSIRFGASVYDPAASAAVQWRDAWL